MPEERPHLPLGVLDHHRPASAPPRSAAVLASAEHPPSSIVAELDDDDVPVFGLGLFWRPVLAQLRLPLGGQFGRPTVVNGEHCSKNSKTDAWNQEYGPKHDCQPQ